MSNVLKLRREEAPEPGQTTEVAALLTFAIGAYLVNGSWAVAFVVAGAVVILLHLKQPMHRFVDAMGERDMTAVMQFVVISLIILPLLPNGAFGPYDVLNPFDIWRMVVLIVGISLIGYVLYKIRGQKAGALLGGALGGLISSTATTVSYARRSREASEAHRLAVIAILISSVVAYARILVEIALVAANRLGQMALPLAAMGVWVAAVSVGAYLLYRGGSEKMPEPSNPAELRSAVIFGALYATVIFLIAVIKEHFGSGALYGIAVISGLTDMDAITLSLARMAEQERIDPATGWRLILSASLANLVFKAVAGSLLGGWRFGSRLFVAFGLCLVGGLAILFLWP